MPKKSFLNVQAIDFKGIPKNFCRSRAKPVNLSIDNVQSRFADVTALPFADASIHSLSCMHVIEHVGLGRYGDRLEYDGDLKAIMELKRVMAPGGTLIIVLPVGRPAIMFNAHRIYSYEHIMACFDGFELCEFAVVPDNGKKYGNDFLRHPDPTIIQEQTYGCGRFWLRKK